MKHKRLNPLAGPALALFVALGAPWSSHARTTEPVVTCRVELDRDVLPAGGGKTAVIKITLDADEAPRKTERPPVNVCIVLDRSGSMSGEKIRRAKDAAVEALHRLDGRDLFSLVVYNHGVKTIVPAQSAANTGWIEDRIRDIGASGNTALFGGVSQGAAEIRKNLREDYIHRVILLSDGLANVGPSQPSDLARLGASLLKEGISVTTIGVGTDYNEDLMTRLSQKSDGNAYFVEQSRDLGRIFDSELGDVLSVVAKRVNLIVECPDGVTPVKVIGREARIRGKHIELFLNQLYGGQEKYALVEIRLPTAQPGEVRELAAARVTYENAVTQGEESAGGRVTGRFSADREEVEASAREEVEKAVVINVNAMAQDDAIRLADENQKEQAAATLEQSADNLRSVGHKYEDSVLLKRAEELEEQAQVIRNEGMDSRQRKSLRTSSYQDYNQQRSR